MPRPLRIHVPGAMYHVTLRGNHRQNIFFTPQDRSLLSELIAEVTQRFDSRVHAYCFMTNHIHALIQVSDAPLGRLMLRIAGRYARVVQRSLRTTGHLFEKRYYPVLVDADEYLLELLRYIHLNPVRARMVQSPDDYPWSSHHVYRGSRDESWVTTDFALAMFHPEVSRARVAYQRFIAAELGQTHRRSPLEECNANDRRILGSDAFAGRVLGASWKPRSPQTLEQIISQACERFRVTEPELCSRIRRRQLVIARAWIAQQCLAGRICSIANVARRLNRDESTIRHALANRALSS
jgi:putative transposase